MLITTLGWLDALAAPLDPTKVLGTYALSEDPTAVQARVDAAVETSVASLPWALRGIARSRMKDLPWCRTWTLAVEGSTLAVRCAGSDRDVTVDLETHKGTTIGRDGSQVPVEASVRDDQLVLTLRGAQGTTVRTYQRSDAGLALSVVSSSDRLPEPLAFQVHYARKPAP